MHRSIVKSAGNEASIYDLVERSPDSWSAPALVVAPGSSMVSAPDREPESTTGSCQAKRARKQRNIRIA
eukprot:6173220-Pleurochrysis_carterae.AAC.3